MFARKEESIASSQSLASGWSTECLNALGPEHTPHVAPSQKNQSRTALPLKPPKKADQLDPPPCHKGNGNPCGHLGGKGRKAPIPSSCEERTG